MIHTTNRKVVLSAVCLTLFAANFIKASDTANTDAPGSGAATTLSLLNAKTPAEAGGPASAATTGELKAGAPKLDAGEAAGAKNAKKSFADDVRGLTTSGTAILASLAKNLPLLGTLGAGLTALHVAEESLVNGTPLKLDRRLLPVDLISGNSTVNGQNQRYYGVRVLSSRVKAGMNTDGNILQKALSTNVNEIRIIDTAILTYATKVVVDKWK